MPDTLLQVAPHVWIFPHDDDPTRYQPNVGIIVAGEHTILIDAGNSPRHARRILLSLDDVQAPAVSYIIYTHSHWDHVFGAMVFGAPAIAHELCRKQLAENASKPWSHSYIQEEIQRSPSRDADLRALGRAIEDWRNFRIVVPEITLSKVLRLYLEDTTIEIEHVSSIHSLDSVVVRLPEAGVLFTGDCYYPPQRSRYLDGNLDTELIQSLVDERIDTYINSYGKPLSRAAFAQLAKQSHNGQMP